MPVERRHGLSGMLLLQAAAVVAAGAFFSLECWLVPAYPAGMLFLLEDDEVAFLWAGAAAAVLGLAYHRLYIWVRGGEKGAKISRGALAFAAVFGATLVMAATSAPDTLQLYAMLIFLFPCSIMVFGIVSGRPWGVALGISLELLIGAGAGSGTRGPAEVLLFAGLFLASVELAWSAASYKAVLETEMAEAADDRRRTVALAAMSGALRSYWAALAASLVAALLALSMALAVFASPGLFGEAYRDSPISGGIVALALPAGTVLAVLAAILMLPRDLPQRARKAVLWARVALARASVK